MLLNFLHPFGFICKLPPLVSPQLVALKVYVVSISEFPLRPCASQRLPAFMCFQYLGFLCPSTTSSPHLVSTSNFPTKCLSSNFLTCLQYLYYTHQEVQRPSPCDTSGALPSSHSAPLLPFSISTLHASSGLSLTQVKVPHLRALI